MGTGSDNNIINIADFGISGDSFFDVLFNMEGAGQSATHTFTDKAGNSASATISVNIDKIAPTLTFESVAPTPNAAGWNNTDVPIGYTASDNLSGLASVSPAITFPV